ncbi:hypothetical protein J6590_032776 [Homalodisca vitripennis]|nr:hypothetical protein J6590_032776 [Homalodisca vitripennis]
MMIGDKLYPSVRSSRSYSLGECPLNPGIVRTMNVEANRGIIQLSDQPRAPRSSQGVGPSQAQ